ncbi:acyl-[acyl-carrier-protein] thioesterase [Oribacterium sinus]|uniref:acyl-[acyl-carrier-protein] thioesterase n=1 Tax=Oribacterium sinus TaxID=237576 RepID=UPI0028E3EC74|nr:acyl-ACP thioesterase domain-containing protein [Oribacterium sinus]
MYEIQERVRYSEVTEKGEMSLFSVVNLLQNCSTFHSHDVGMSIEVLRKKHRAWLLSAWNIELYALPKLYEKLSIGTSPHNFRGIFAYRNFWIQNEAREFYVKADSEWFSFDLEKGRPGKITEELIAPFKEREDVLHLPPLQRKIAFPESYQEGESIPVVQDFLDTNHHMNNAKYIALAEEVIFQCTGKPAILFTQEEENLESAEKVEKQEKSEIKKEFYSIRAEYVKAYTLGDSIFPRIAIEEDRTVVAFYNQNKELCCHVEIRKNPDA